ncbi:MAG TPA: pyruvate, phosphate dikinase, partial [Dehalococcoidia bacterium]|nr:pyruvate, phosphate dikinase [Dehalococcoidia bacterium]
MIYQFEEGDASMRDLLGGKGSGLCEMARMGLPIPPGFVITTQVCLDYFASGRQFPAGLMDRIQENVAHLEKVMGRGFGSTDNPLLVSVRSGAKISMPGMMDTILNLGINDDIVDGLAKLMGDPRPAYDAHRRFLQIYADVVMDVGHDTFEEILTRHKQQARVSLDCELNVEQLRDIIADFKIAIRQAAGVDVPHEPAEQLGNAIEAVFRSWNNLRAIHYRDFYGIPHDLGTAVSVMSMVFGNLGPTSGTGVLFTRNPSTGQREVYGEFLANAQGEDVVAGLRTPQPISSLAQVLPQVHGELMALAQRLENHYRNVQDVEFTVEAGRLFILQTRNAKRTPTASVKTAVDMFHEGLIDRKEALLRVDPEEVSQLLVPRFDVDLESPQVQDARLAQGAPASPGAASGQVYFEAAKAAAMARKGTAVILVRQETKPDDIQGIISSAGILTTRGGVTSHAAVVTRGMGKPCIVGCEEVQVDLAQGLFMANGRAVHEGECISIDGTSGNVYYGQLATVSPHLNEIVEATELLTWADQTRILGVKANADTPEDASHALAMGAQGIGLCRTEHMFMNPERLPVVRQMLLNAESAEEWRREQVELTQDPLSTADLPEHVRDFYDALAQVRQFQTADFEGILRVMGDRTVTIRLLDAPLHEFLPPYEKLLTEYIEGRASGQASAEELAEKGEFLRLVDSHRESNPMLGHRGCRLGLSFPAIYQMQVEAIITAAARLKQQGVSVHPQIMVPLTVDVAEMRRLRQHLSSVAARVQERLGVVVPYKFGTMIETPRAAVTAGKIAQESEFFSFGTNDLTQLAYGFSRDDAEGKFLRAYIAQGILPADPFATIDTEGVGNLVRRAATAGREARPDIELGICGEHGGDPASIAFFHEIGLDYVSCSPYRVPVARL